MTKKYGKSISNGMVIFLNIIDASENAYSIKNKDFLFMEHLKGNLKESNLFRLK